MPNIPWYFYVIIFLAVVVGILQAFFPKKGKKRSNYILKSTLITKNEQHFFEVLYSIAEKHYYVLAQVRLADIFKPKNSDRSTYYTALNKITSKHVDFLLCSKDFKPLVGIELDDSTHQREDRKKRDSFVNELFEGAGLPLLHFRPQKNYNPDEIIAAITEALKKEMRQPEQKEPAPVAPQNKGQTTAPVCPICFDSMIQRQGRNGKKFWGCSNFPKCRGTVSIEDS